MQRTILLSLLLLLLDTLPFLKLMILAMRRSFAELTGLPVWDLPDV